MTPVIAASYSECVVEFSYHMYGVHTGILHIELQPAPGYIGKHDFFFVFWITVPSKHTTLF